MISLSEFRDVEQQPEKRPELPGGEQALLVRKLVERVHELAHLQLNDSGDHGDDDDDDDDDDYGDDGEDGDVGEGQARQGVPLHGNCLQRVLVPPS